MEVEDRHCQVCNVQLPSVNSFADHELGKQHVRNLLQQKERERLAKCSVFLYGFPRHCFASEEAIARPLSEQIGPVNRVILDKNKGTFAIVEFSDDISAKTCIERRKFKIGSQTVLAKERHVDFERNLDEISQKPNFADILDKLNISATTDFDQQVDLFLENTVLSGREEQLRRVMIGQLTEYLRDYMPDGAGVVMFGSSNNGLGVKGCDLDATVIFQSGPLRNAALERTEDEQKERKVGRSKLLLMTAPAADLTGDDKKVALEELAKLSLSDRVRYVSKMLNFARKFKHASINNQVPLLEAKCPLVRFVFEKGMVIDLSVDNRLGLIKCEWVKSVMNADSSLLLRKLLTLLRLWIHTVDESHESKSFKMTNYSFTLLILTYLMERKFIKPLVAEEEMASKYEMSFLDGWDVSFVVEPFSMAAQHTDLATLIKDVMLFLAQTKLKDTVFSPRLGRRLNVTEFDEIYKEDDRVCTEFKKSQLNVQDPFELSHNTSANVGDKWMGKMRAEAAVVLKRLKSVNSPLVTLFDTRNKGNAAASSQSTNSSQLRIEISTDLSWDEALSITRRALTEILHFEEILDPLRKRPRLAEKDSDGQKRQFHQSQYRVGVRLWQGRRLKRREVHRAQEHLKTEFEVEMEVTRQLMAEEIDSNRPSKLTSVMTLSLKMEMKERHLLLLEIGLIYGAETEYRNLSRFLDAFLRKLFSDSHRANCSDEAMII